MVHPVSNYSLPYELTFSLKPEQVIKFTEIQSFSDCQKSKVFQIVRSFKFFSPVWISLVRGAGLLKVVELHVFIQLLQ